MQESKIEAEKMKQQSARKTSMEDSQWTTSRILPVKTAMHEDSLFGTHSVDAHNQKTSAHALTSRLGSLDETSIGLKQGGAGCITSVTDHLSNLDIMKSRRASALPPFTRPNIDRFLHRGDRSSRTRGVSSGIRTAAMSIGIDGYTDKGGGKQSGE